jgi:hypothetical protein
VLPKTMVPRFWSDRHPSGPRDEGTALQLIAWSPLQCRNSTYRSLVSGRIPTEAPWPTQSWWLFSLLLFATNVVLAILAWIMIESVLGYRPVDRESFLRSDKTLG